MSKREKRDGETGEQAATEEPYASRTERTRAAQAVNKMGRCLIRNASMGA